MIDTPRSEQSDTQRLILAQIFRQGRKLNDHIGNKKFSLGDSVTLYDGNWSPMGRKLRQLRKKKVYGIVVGKTARFVDVLTDDSEDNVIRKANHNVDIIIIANRDMRQNPPSPSHNTTQHDNPDSIREEMRNVKAEQTRLAQKVIDLEERLDRLSANIT